MALKTYLLALLSTAAVSAAATGRLDKKDACAYTCGSSSCYWQSDIDNAVSKGYSLLEYGETLGSGNYPHQYNDREGFDFSTSGPWYEFPILSSFEVYSGGSPGADRVIFDSNGNFDSVITHTSAGGDNFVACTQD